MSTQVTVVVAVPTSTLEFRSLQDLDSLRGSSEVVSVLPLEVSILVVHLHLSDFWQEAAQRITEIAMNDTTILFITGFCND